MRFRTAAAFLAEPRRSNTMGSTAIKLGLFAAYVFSLLLVTTVVAQETTGGLQGTVKDPSGAVISGASGGTDQHLPGG